MKPDTFHRHQRLVMVLVGLLLACLLLSGGWHIVSHYRSTVEETAVRQQVYVNALAEHAERTLGEAAQILNHIERELRQQGGYQGLPEKTLFNLFSQYMQNVPQISSIFLADSTGRVKATSLGFLTKPIVLADRDYFLQHRDTPSTALYYSRPFRSKYDTTWRFSISRRINNPDGSFSGLVGVALPTAYFQTFYQDLKPQPTERISLIRTDGYLQATFPSHDDAYTTNHSGSELLTRQLTRQLSGSFTGTVFTTDHTPRKGVYRTLQHAPLIASISIEPAAAMAGWRSHLIRVIGLMLLATATILWLAARLTRQMKSSHQELEQLVEQRTRSLVDTSHELSVNQARLQALLEISRFNATDTQQLLDFALQKVLEVTNSQFGYIYHYHEDRREFVLNSWSKEVMPACSVANPQSTYQLEKTGIWGEAVRQRRPILINDFAAPDPLKKGYPDGHVHLSRFLTVPVFDSQQQIVAVVGVANKELPYGDEDLRQLDLMMAEVWRIVKRLELELQLTRAGHEWQTTFDTISDSICLMNADQQVLRCNRASLQMFEQEFKEIIGQHCWQLVHGTDGPVADCPMQRAKKTHTTESQLFYEKGRWLHVTVDPLLDGDGSLTGAVHIVRDDTERVKADQSVRELLAMLEAVQNELYVFSSDTLRIEYANQSAQRNLGYNLEQLQQLHPFDLKPYTRLEFMQLIAPLSSKETHALRFETTHRRADGSRYPVEVNLQRVEKGTGNCYLAVIHDITERKQAEEALLRSQALIDSIMNSLETSIAVIDATGKIIRVNTEWSTFALQNNGAAELATGIGLNYFDVCRQTVAECPDVAELLTGIKAVQNRLIPSFSAEYPCHSPTEQRWFIVYATALENSDGGVVLTHLNITSRKLAELELGDALVQAQRFRTALDYVNAFIYIKDCESRYVYANQPCLELLNCTAEELPGSSDSQFFPPETVARLHAVDARVLSGERTTEEITTTLPDGEIRIYLELKTPVFADTTNELISGLLGISTDITTLKQSEAAMRELHAQLLQNEKLASIGQLSAGIAHEINNPMGFINSNLNTLEKYIEKFDTYIALLEELVQKDRDPQPWQTASAVKRNLKLEYVLRDVHQLIQESTEGAERVMKIVHDLKTFSRSDTSQTGKADINQNLDSTINIIWNQIKYVAELVRDYGELPKVPCNIQQVNQVFMNLLVNAVHALQYEEIEELGTITVKTWADEEHAYIAISDTGCGIPEDIRNRIFDPFFTTKDVGKGTGLGLSISHEIIKKHGGELSVTSTEGKGTTFTIRLPLSPPPKHKKLMI